MERIIVIGNGMVGYKFCEKLRAKAGKSDFEITVFGEEPRPAYDRVHLSAYFTGTTVEELTMAPREWYEENEIELLTGELVTEIDRENKTVKSHKGTVLSYDKLILATGSSAFVPPIKGVEKQGVFVYRTIEDLDAMMAYGKKVKSAAVMGGGLLGLEAAKAVLDMGLETHVVEFAPRLMPRQLDDQGSSVLQCQLEDLGINIHLGKNTQEIKGNGKLDGLSFNDGTELNVEMLVISAGIRPRDELARQHELEVGPRGGILVDDHLKTTDPDIFAIGEAALHKGMIYGLVAPGYEMADVVVNQLIKGDEKAFTDFDMSTKLKLIGTDVASFGDAFGEKEPFKAIVFEDKVSGVYKRINISEDGKRLLGGMLVGDAEAYNMLLQIAQNGMALPPNPEDLILGARGGEEAVGNGVEALPDTAQICSCENISKGDICKAITEDGFENIADIKKCTKAGTGCGGCVPLINDLITETLKSMGRRVRKTICEHFDYTRQELFDLVKINDIKTYDELLDKYGEGDGCEVCKPAVASILASAWNEMILEKSMTIQDTNDKYLANIQKGGTYSVVPRIPGGEITPDKLIVIGQVAKKYNLYTKITGGQRIDLFGARLDQLPDIWEELVNAGFESGHAYGKSLRTVKSCVGSTWCRYGQQDSVSFAIEVEERYRGLRSPHKLKSAVSGCIRECAEAQSKDFGIIATENGWNLYVGGNGGAKPQHALLLAADIDKESVIKYIDRFLMFYIKTAEPLTRTAPWLNKLEGGLDYLKDVIINDCLGIGEQLESEMQLLIDAYKCEWKEVVNNPEMRARFKHFVNVEDVDPNLSFKEMRGQKFPTSWG
ncbi:nitrite reductase large subunit NirB [Flexithrix dorotheae]|uniref:nitrite reductase large subunit NirB n=1 Tax=Flexithrix dorotheae TaxID=70993 RepID=UPI000370C837|nr:nitrite reductase large subunit NirB [Flexithrix dorotheae]